MNKINHTITVNHCINSCAREHYKQRACHCTEGKEKSTVCLIKQRTVKANGVEVELHEILIPTLDGGERLIHICGEISKFPVWIFRARTECSYHTAARGIIPKASWVSVLKASFLYASCVTQL